MKPRIRLKGFEGEWELTSFGRNVKLRRGLTYSPTDVCSNGIRVLRSSNIDEDTFVVSKDDVFVNDKCVNIPFANQGDILITAANGSPRLVGKHCLINTDDMNMVHGGFMLLASSPESDFYNASMGSGWYTSFKRIGISGGNGAIGNLDKTELENFKLYIPNSRCERDGLANYFKSLDELIQSTTQKVASLKQLKEASLISMFPQGNETTPRVRFKGFEGEWEKKKFSDLYNHVIQKNDMSFGTDKIISVANMYYISNALISEIDYLKTYNVFRLGDIAFEGNKSKIFAHGRFVENSIGDGIVSHVFEVFRPIMSNYDINFWKYAINNERLMGKLLIRCTKSSTMMTNLVSKDFLNETFLVPSYEEQCSIGTFFQTLDTQITLQEQRLEKLKQLKSACLDQMFV